jgi:hypothetical protein
MYYIDKLPSVIYIGRVGENNFRDEEFDLTVWMEQYPDGIPSIVVIRPGDSDNDAYVAATSFSNNILTWNISDADTGRSEGTGSIQIWLMELDEQGQVISRLGKSAVVAIRIEETIGGVSSDPPAQQAPWLEQMTSLKNQTITAKEAAVAAQSAAETAQGAAETAQSAAETAQSGAVSAKDGAETAQAGAQASALDSEAWAEGTRNAEPVESDDPTYNSNSKYHAEHAAASASTASSAAGSATSAKNDAETAKAAAEEAQGKAEVAQDAAEEAQANAELWAAGTESGTPGENNNSRYYAEQSAKWATGSESGSGNTPGATNNAEYYAGQASNSADAAASSAEAAAAAAEAMIDDTAGDGDTNKVWSADKLTDTFATKVDKVAGKGLSKNDFTDAYKSAVDGAASKVSDATNGNFAALDANGDLVDSGHKHSDYITSHQDISGKADKVSSATNNNFAALDSNGNLTDSGHKHSDYLTSHQDITGKADKVSGATSGNFAGLDNNGNLTDSGKKPADYLPAANVYNDLDQTASGYALDARQGNALNQAIATFDYQIVTSGDFNNLTGNNVATVWYRGENLSNFTNTPSDVSSNAWPFALEVIKVGQGYVRQILHIYAVYSGGKTQIRTFVRQQTYREGTIQWGAWEEFAIKQLFTTNFTGTTDTYGNILLKDSSGNMIDQNHSILSVVTAIGFCTNPTPDSGGWVVKVLTGTGSSVAARTSTQGTFYIVHT